MTTLNLNNFKKAYYDTFKYHSENIIMLSCYVKSVIASILKEKRNTLISLGIGHKIVCTSIINKLGHSLSHYTIVEGSEEIISEFLSGFEPPENLKIKNSFFEKFTPAEKVDAIEMGFILEHVDNPSELLKRYTNFLNPNGKIFIAIPNALSLHRLIGHHAGYLEDLYKLSEYDLELGHKRYFDIETIKKHVIEAGLKICNIEGIFLKPLTTDQLNSLNLTEEVYKSLCTVGSKHPEIANGIYIEASI